ncbi:aminoglycoside phosphotransferase family protein [Arthrobacter sp. H5]|uniref:aminoglycoside phosphotransferase family protein n=1 Tax=Arthrobacter sp. H5 TaxID=1267973 RepID=UPI001C1E7EB0|nr:aminoglycoside phosphotransferase family protein [Arthrobacter sp. H5]
MTAEPTRMHADQLDLPLTVVSGLIAEQFPQWKDLPVSPIESQGTVNAIYRIGSKLTARFPLQPQEPGPARERLEEEAFASREFLGHTHVPTPEPVAIGVPCHGYPMPWSVQTWLEGAVATENVAVSDGFAEDIADFICDVRSIPTRGRRFNGKGRGGDFPRHDAWMKECFRRSESLIDVGRAHTLWNKLRALPREHPDVMNHGDLIPGNVLVQAGRLSGILDVGGLAAADPALDLVSAWHLLEHAPREAFRRKLVCTDLEWSRGQAWAFEQAMGLVWYYVETNPAMHATGQRTLARILASPTL